MQNINNLTIMNRIIIIFLSKSSRTESSRGNKKDFEIENKNSKNMKKKLRNRMMMMMIKTI